MLCPHVIQKPDILRQRAPKMFNPFPSFLEADIYDKVRFLYHVLHTLLAWLEFSFSGFFKMILNFRY